MENPKTNEPLWIIKFQAVDSSEKSYRQRAEFSPKNSSKHLLVSMENQRQALEFLDRINSSFKDITEAYLAIAENDESLRPQAEEMRERLNTLNQWLKWIRSWLNKPEKED